MELVLVVTNHFNAATGGRFDFSVTGWTSGDLNLSAILELQNVVYQRLIAFGTAGIDRHPTIVAFVCCHFSFKGNKISSIGSNFCHLTSKRVFPAKTLSKRKFPFCTSEEVILPLM